ERMRRCCLRAHPQGDPPQRRLVFALRQQCDRHYRQRVESARHAHLRAGGARVARKEIHENCLPGPRGDLTPVLSLLFLLCSDFMLKKATKSWSSREPTKASAAGLSASWRRNSG